MVSLQKYSLVPVQHMKWTNNWNDNKLEVVIYSFPSFRLLNLSRRVKQPRNEGLWLVLHVLFTSRKWKGNEKTNCIIRHSEWKIIFNLSNSYLWLLYARGQGENIDWLCVLFNKMMGELLTLLFLSILFWKFLFPTVNTFWLLCGCLWFFQFFDGSLSLNNRSPCYRLGRENRIAVESKAD